MESTNSKSRCMTRFEAPDPEAWPDDVQSRIQEETEQAGFTPNVFPAMAYRPSHFRAFVAYYDALTEDSRLSKDEIEMIVVTISGVNDCLYCIVAHGALLRIFSKKPKLADELAANHRTADLTDRHRAMLDFAVKLTESPERVGEADLQELRDQGFSNEQIWDIGSVTAFFNLSNRLALMADMRPNEEFYAMGR